MPEICDTDLMTDLSDPKRDFSYISMPYGQLFSYILKMFHFFESTLMLQTNFLYADPHFFEVGSVHWLLVHIF